MTYALCMSVYVCMYVYICVHVLVCTSSNQLKEHFQNLLWTGRCASLAEQQDSLPPLLSHSFRSCRATSNERAQSPSRFPCPRLQRLGDDMDGRCAVRETGYSVPARRRGKRSVQTLVPWKLLQPLLRAAWEPEIAPVAVAVSHRVTAV